MQLLAVGRSFVGHKSETGRYKTTEQNLLPDFTTGEKNEAPSAVYTNPAADSADFMFGAPHRKVAGAEGKGAAAPAVRPMAAPAQPEPPATATVLAKRPARRRFFGLGSLGRTKVEGGSLVQSELSLETVKVVRNDLSDADLELVPAKIAARPELPMPKVSSLPPRNGAAGMVWSRLTARIFENNRSRFR